MEVTTELQESKIGLIPKDWQFYTLKDITSITRLAGYEYSQYWQEDDQGEIIALRGYNIGEGRLRLNDVAYINKSLSNKLKRSQLSIGDIVYPCVGTIGNAVVIPEDNKYHIQQNLAKITCKDSCDPFFIEQYLRSDLAKQEVYRFNATTTQPNVLVGSLRQFRISLPPLPEQEKITTILTTWDKNIEKTHHLIKQLELRKKGLMQKLLTGKKRLPGFEGEWKKYEIGEIASQFTDKNKDNSITEVLSCTKYDGLVKSLEYFGRKVFGDDLTKYKVVPRNHFAYATNHIEEGSIGYQNLLDAGLVSPMYTVFKTNNMVDDFYFYRLLKTDRMLYQYQSNMSGSIARRGGLRWNAFKEIIVALPPIEEQKAIASFFVEVDNEIILQQSKLDSLKSQKKGLMQELLTGKKRVKI